MFLVLGPKVWSAKWICRQVILLFVDVNNSIWICWEDKRALIHPCAQWRYVYFPMIWKLSCKKHQKISKTSGIYDILFMIMCSWICHLHSRVFQVHLILFHSINRRTIPLAAKAVYRLEAFQSSLFFNTYIDFFSSTKPHVNLINWKKSLKRNSTYPWQCNFYVLAYFAHSVGNPIFCFDGIFEIFSIETQKVSRELNERTAADDNWDCCVDQSQQGFKQSVQLKKTTITYGLITITICPHPAQIKTLWYCCL